MKQHNQDNKHGMSRREFFKRIGIGAALSTPLLAACAGKDEAAVTSDEPTGTMTYRINPKTNEKVSLLGYGCMRWPTMPPADVLPAIMLKSTLLAIVAAIVATRYPKVSLSLLVLVVLLYQAFGTLGECLLCGDIALAMQDLRVGIPGMLLQIFGGYALIRLLK